MSPGRWFPGLGFQHQLAWLYISSAGDSTSKNHAVSVPGGAQFFFGGGFVKTRFKEHNFKEEHG